MPQHSQQVQQIEQRVLREALQSIEVTSPAFAPGAPIPRDFSTFGDDRSPPLAWRNVPEDARALALVVDDPDAPVGLFTHWTAWNIPPRERALPQDASRKSLKSIGGVEGRNDFGEIGWNGPEPPSGTHRYFFRLLALDAPLDLPEGATPAEVWRALEGRVLAWGELRGDFTRPS